MKFFIGITPPEEIKERIIEFQRSFPNNHLPEKIEPHITVKAQAGLTADTAWIAKVESVARKYKIFTVSFNGIGTFDQGVVYIKPFISHELSNLHKQLVEAVDPDKEELKNYFELERFNPHLSLGGVNWGLRDNDVTELKRKAEIELTDIPSFEVSFIRVYRQTIPHGPYSKLIDIPFQH